MEKLLFYGKMEAEIEDRFLKWQQANAESVRNIKKHPIQSLPLTATPMLLRHQKIEAADAFSMLWSSTSGSISRPGRGAGGPRASRRPSTPVMVMPGGLLRGSGAAWRLAECVTGAGPARPVVRLALRKAGAAGCDEQREHQSEFCWGH